MGQTTFVKSTNRPITAGRLMSAFKLHLDVPLTIFTLALIVFGLLMVYSSSWKDAQSQGELESYYLVRQIGFCALGVLVALGLSLFDYHRYQRLLIPMIILILVSLVVVAFFGETRYNSRRALFNGSVQPSEFAVLALIIYLAFWLYNKREVLNILSFGLAPMTFILGIFGGLVWLQPDFSAAITILVMGGILFFLAGAEMRQVLFVSIASILIGLLVISATSTGRTRFAWWVAGINDPGNASDHIQRSFEAIVRGGVFGVGFGNSVTKFTGMPFPWTDSIYAIIIEETGLVGATAVLALYIALLWRGIQIAQRAPDQLGRLIASGVTMWIAFDAILNMGVMVSLFPFAGNALPLISYGGSNMLSTLMGIGILMNISRSTTRKTIEKQEGRSYGAVVDMRRRDRRRSVSRPVGSVIIED
jgi:cell division protein FtsW